MKEDYKRVSFVLFHILSQFGYLFTLYLFSSNYEQLPWYEPDFYKYYHLTISVPLPIFFSLIIGFTLRRESIIEKCIQAIYPIAFLIIVTYLTNMGIYGMPQSEIGVLIVFILYTPSVILLLLDIKRMKTITRRDISNGN